MHSTSRKIRARSQKGAKHKAYNPYIHSYIDRYLKLRS